MHYVIHTNVFKEAHWDMLMNFVQKNELSYEIIPFQPFVEHVEIEYKGTDVWCWGSVSLSRIAKNYGWTPGSMMNENHDMDVYGKHYCENMLNAGGVIMRAGDPLPEWADFFFARPTKDSKAFTGQLFSREAWYEWLPDAIQPGKISNQNIFTRDTMVLIAPLRNIQQEVRCWVVGGKVVTASRYKLGSKTWYQNYDDESYFVDFAQKMVDIYQPAEAFVIDVCLANDELKVVEVNCINCAGFYHANMDKLMMAIENQFAK